MKKLKHSRKKPTRKALKFSAFLKSYGLKETSLKEKPGLQASVGKLEFDSLDLIPDKTRAFCMWQVRVTRTQTGGAYTILSGPERLPIVAI